jgi:hypothetical protein
MSFKARVSNWLNIETLTPEFGVEVLIAGTWRHLAENNVAFVTPDITAANVKAVEVSSRLNDTLVTGGVHVRN